jgi:hypothetical protein
VGVFALIATVLGAVGVYGVMTSPLLQRTQRNRDSHRDGDNILKLVGGSASMLMD